MLEARKTSIWSNSDDITLDGRPLARWNGSSWKAGGAAWDQAAAAAS